MPDTASDWPGAGDDLRPLSAIFPGDALARLSPRNEIIWANPTFWSFFDRAPPSRRRFKLAALIGRTGAQQMQAGLDSQGQIATSVLTNGKDSDGASQLLTWDICDDGQGEGLLLRVRVDDASTPEARVLRGLKSVAYESSPGILIVGPNGLIQWVNPGFAALTGYSEDEVIGQRPQDLLDHPEASKSTLARIQAAVQGGKSISTDVLNRRKDGSAIWFDLQISPLYDSLGKLAGYFSVQSDVTPRLERQRELEQAREFADAAHRQLTTAVNAMTDGFVFFDKDERLVLCNAKYRALFTEAAPVLTPGTKLETIFRYAAAHNPADPDPENLEQIVQDRLMDFRSSAEKTLVRTSKGRSVRIINHRTPDGGVVGLRVDITELAQKEAALEEARAETLAAQERLITAVESLPDGFAYFDADDRLVLCNQQFRKIYAQSAPAMVPGATFSAILKFGLRQGQFPEAAGREREWVDERLAAHAQAAETVEQELPDGRWLRIIERKTPDGGRVGLRMDITELKRKQSELGASNARLRQAASERDLAQQRFSDVAAISRDWFWEIDADGNLTHISSAFERTFGIETDHCLGRPMSKIGHPNGRAPDADWNRFNKWILTRHAFADFVVRIADIHGELRWIRLGGTPFHDDEGQHAGFRGAGTDVTDLYETLITAQQANAAKSDFLAAISHEIRTPLNGILGLAQELSLRVEGAGTRHLTASIQDSGEALLNVINDILDFSRIEAGKLSIERHKFRFSDILRKVEAVHGRTAAQKSIGLEIKQDRDLPPWFWGDPHRILQIFNNLVSNGLKFTHEGQVEIGVKWSGGMVQISFCDSGIGMTKDQIATIFDSFSDRDPRDNRQGPARGLGMAITKKLTEAMDGTIDIQSEPGEGSRISVRLPLERAAELQPAQATLPMSATSVAPLDCSNLKLLVADDTASNRLLMKLLIDRMGSEAVIVEDGEKAVAAAKDQDFDVLLLDISMPGMDGVETMKAIHADQKTNEKPPTPAVAVTANTLEHQIKTYKSQGFTGHVAKPIDRVALERAIADCVKDGP